ncbi:MAG: hypothetical protein HY308_17795 [Gammaproteobacteria bacterium]|nr:hypothetical protein [Gammaproteobacteria bacterium]
MHLKNPKNRQRGYVLVMALVLLTLLTIMGLTAMSTTTLEEKMAGNMKDRNLAFQAAETALVSGESWARDQLNKPPFTNSNGLYSVSATTSPRWDTVSWSSASSDTAKYPCSPTVSASCGSGLTKVSTQPKYIIEDLGEVPEVGGSLVVPANYKGKGITVLRITGRGTGGTDAAKVMVQSTYAREY